MKTAAKVFYIITVVTTAISILFILAALVAIIAVGDEEIAELIRRANLPTYFVESVFVAFAAAALFISVAVLIAMLVVAIIGFRAVSANKTGIGIHVAAIVLGVMGGIFFLLAGIFALVDISDRKKNESVSVPGQSR